MKNFMPSIRQKITFAYFAITAMIIGLSVFTFLELRYIERKIMFGEAITEFFDTTLEIRRFEKNYVMYEKRPDYLANIGYVARAQDIINNDMTGFSALASPQQIADVQADLAKYKDFMAQYERLSRGKSPEDAATRSKLEGEIRRTGKAIITLAEEMSRTERKSIQHLLGNSQSVLIVSILFLCAMVITLGQVLSRMVVKPLHSLEESMRVIAEGKFKRVAIDSKDREIVSLTKAFNKMLKELELHERHLIQSEKLASLGTLLSGVAHELNNPLSNISSSNQILMEEFKEARERPDAGPWPLDADFSQELIMQINEQTDRARNIVRSLLDFSRDREFKKESLSLTNLFEETIRFIKGQLPAKITVSFALPDDIVFFADKQRLQQVLLNLIKNAIDAIEPNEGTILIKAEKRRAIEDIEDEKIGITNYLKFRGKCTLDEDTVDIVIRDTGPGIPQDLLPKIFDPFFTTKDVGKGSGLGLFVVHEIIEEHDGCIAVDSEPGKGTTFLIRLPLRQKA
jgi:two-component system, NtrC family, sensor kinase